MEKLLKSSCRADLGLILAPAVSGRESGTGEGALSQGVVNLNSLRGDLETIMPDDSIFKFITG